MAENWTEEQYDQLQIYLDRKKLLKDIEAEVKARQAMILHFMNKHDIQAAATDDEQVVVCRRKVQYSDELQP